VRANLRPLPEAWGDVTVLEGLLPQKTAAAAKRPDGPDDGGTVMSQGPTSGAASDALGARHLIARDRQAPSPPPAERLDQKGELFDFPGNWLPD
jgi:hypothetical protein